jgi:hypothetical protein
MADWLLDETQTPDDATLKVESDVLQGGTRSDEKAALAIRLNEIIIHDTKKWFGGANIRLDAIVVRGLAAGDEAATPFYQPSTFRFSGVQDGDRLPVEAPGLLIFYGWPTHFVDISIMASRDTGDSADLSKLIGARLNSDEWKTASQSLLALTAVAPQAAAIAGALGGAAVIGNFAADVLRTATDNTIGLYRASWLQYRDAFGLGRHPEDDAFRQRDLSFWYEVVLDESAKGMDTGRMADDVAGTGAH